jgi:hypothetical protein
MLLVRIRTEEVLETLIREDLRRLQVLVRSR